MDTAFGGLKAGDALDDLSLTISVAANERYWQAAGLDHPLLQAGAIYPLIAANLIVLALTHHSPDAMIQTSQQLQCHRIAFAPAALLTRARVHERYEKRGLQYIVVAANVTVDGDSLWDASAHFTPAARVNER